MPSFSRSAFRTEGRGNAVEHLFEGPSLCNGTHLPVSPDHVAKCTNLEVIQAFVGVLEAVLPSLVWSS